MTYVELYICPVRKVGLSSPELRSTISDLNTLFLHFLHLLKRCSANFSELSVAHTPLAIPHIISLSYFLLLLLCVPLVIFMLG